MSTWCVYVRDWIISYVSEASGQPGLEEAQAVFAERWEGRLEEADYSFQYDPSLRVQVWTRIPSLQGRWTEEPDAHEHAYRLSAMERESPPQGLILPGTTEIVESGSAAERALLDYGKKKLRVQ